MLIQEADQRIELLYIFAIVDERILFHNQMSVEVTFHY
jgi:hypothetical protein